MNRKAFTVVEIIISLSLLMILWTISFINLSDNTNDALKVKMLSDIQWLNSEMWISISKWNDISKLIINSNSNNLVNSGSFIEWWKYKLWDLKYKAWQFNFKILNLKKDNYVYIDRWIKKEYILWYIRTSKKIYFEFAWEILNKWWKNEALISWNYFKFLPSDSHWLISEKNFDIWIINWEVLKWSFY